LVSCVNFDEAPAAIVSCSMTEVPPAATNKAKYTPMKEGSLSQTTPSPAGVHVSTTDRNSVSVQPGPPVMNYQRWPGKSYVCCGHCLLGPDVSVLCSNAGLILANSGLFSYFVAYKLHIATLVVGIAITALTLAALYNATFRDPGILPRLLKTDPPALNESAKRPAPTGKQNGVEVPLKFCTTCNIYRPPRASHCRYCDNCVDEFDHHCPWVCNCVGKRNYRFFIMFVMSVTLLCAYVFTVTLAFIIKESIDDGFATFASGNVVSLLLCAEMFCIGCCLVPLASYHCYLVATGITTKEEARGLAPVQHQDDCCTVPGWAAWRELFFSPLPPSLLRLRQPFASQDPSGLLDANLERNRDTAVVEFLGMQGIGRRPSAKSTSKIPTIRATVTPAHSAPNSRAATPSSSAPVATAAAAAAAAVAASSVPLVPSSSSDSSSVSAVVVNTVIDADAMTSSPSAEESVSIQIQSVS